MDELPQTAFDKFKLFLSEPKSFKEVANYFTSNNLHKSKGGAVIYCFKSLTGKKYYGKTNDIFIRLQDYIHLNKSYVNTDLKDDLLFNGRDYFTFFITNKFNGMIIDNSNILDAENFYTANGGENLYNKTNKKLKLTVRTTKPAKNLKSKYKKLDKQNPDKFSGFGDIFD